MLRLPNLAQLSVGALDDSALLVLTSNIVETVYATLSLHKVDQDTGAALPGAVFTIYRTRADALARRAPIAVTAPTDASGMAYLAGLHVSDFQNNDSDTDRYWVVETTVPVGYVGRTEPYEVRLLRDGRTDPADSTGGFRVPNPRADSSRPGPGPLARTGLDALVEIALALLLVGGGVVLVILGRRRHHREDPA